MQWTYFSLSFLWITFLQLISQSAQSMDSKVFVWLSPLLHFLLHQSSNSKKPVSMKSLSRPEIQKMIVYFHVKLLWLYRTVNSNRLKTNCNRGALYTAFSYRTTFSEVSWFGCCRACTWFLLRWRRWKMFVYYNVAVIRQSDTPIWPYRTAIGW